MVEYGYINESGYLVSRQISDKVENYKDEVTGIIRRNTVTIDDQLSCLDKKWKPVDNLDENKTVCESGYVIRIIPFDAGDRIVFKYKKVFDKNAIKSKIEKLKERLSSSTSEIGDYRITKCYEASLLGKDLPYDIDTLYKERQAIRDKINELEALLNQEGDVHENV